MTVTALVMAGGKGTRLALKEEKPMLEVGSKTLVELVLAALGDAKKVDSVVVAVSPNTPKTAEFLKRSGTQVVITPGKDYVSDMGYAVKTLKLDTVLVIAADLPLLTGAIIDDIVERFLICKKPALAVAVPKRSRDKLGLAAGYILDIGGEQIVYAGINMVDGKRIEDAELDQTVCVIDKVEVTLNVNTVSDLSIAKSEFARHKKNKN